MQQLERSIRWRSIFVAGGWALRNVNAGLISGLITVTYALSYAAVIFAGELDPWLPYGIAMTLITAVVVTCITSMFGTISTGIAGPDIYSTLPLAAMVAAAVVQLPAQSGPETLLAALTLATVLTGVGLMLLGAFRGAIVIRYVPFPVFAGFLAATGWLIIAAAVQMVSKIRLEFATIGELVGADVLFELAAALAFALLILAVTNWIRHFLILPVLILLGAAAVHGGLQLAGLDLTAAREAGWLFDLGGESRLWMPFRVEAWTNVDWPTLATILPHMFAVLAVTAIAVVMNASSIEVATGISSDLNRELRVEGVASFASGGLGGVTGSLSLSRTALNQAAGATGRTAGVVCGLFAGGVLLAGPDILSLIPVTVVAGLLIYLGLEFLWKWTLGNRQETSRVDMIMALAILVIVARYGYVAGVGVGILTGCIVFSVRYARVPFIKHRLSLAERRSNVDRSPQATVVLSRFGRSVPILELQGYLFFGTAYDLQEHVKALLTEARVVVLDFKLVSGLDSSAALGFKKMAREAAEREVELVFASLNPPCRQELQLAGLLGDGRELREFRDLDTALEFCENQLLAASGALSDERRLFLEWLADELRSAQAARDLEAVASEEQIAPGDFLCREGEPTDSLLFLESGRVDVVLGLSGPKPVRLRAIEGRTVLGEMGFYTGAPRSASIVAETDSVVHRLSRAGYQRLSREHPEASHALATFVIRLLAERLKIANSLIAAYER